MGRSKVSSISSRYNSHLVCHGCALRGLNCNSYCTGRLWCLCRMLYQPVAVLYGKRFVGLLTPTILALREEIYNTAYDKIDWNEARSACAKVCCIDRIIPIFCCPIIQLSPIVIWNSKRIEATTDTTSIRHLSRGKLLAELTRSINCARPISFRIRTIISAFTSPLLKEEEM